MGTLTSGLILTALCFCFLLGLATGVYLAIFLSIRYSPACPECNRLQLENGDLHLRITQLEKLLEKAMAKQPSKRPPKVTQERALTPEHIPSRVTKSPIETIPVTPRVTKKKTVTKKLGRPTSGNALTAAEKQRLYRERKAAAAKFSDKSKT